MSVRTDLAAELVRVLPNTWDVDPVYRVPDGIETGRPRVVVYTTTVRPHDVRSLRTHEVTLWLLTPLTDPALADDDLDGNLLPVLLDVLDRLPVTTWTEAERGTLGDGFAGYRITLTTTADKE